MSMEALLAAKRDHLRSALGSVIPGGADSARHYIDIQPEGRPSANMGEWYIGLDEAGVESSERSCLREVFRTTAVITHRAAQLPRDRYGTLYEATGVGIGAIERAVIVAIHGNHDLRQLANTLANVPGALTGDIFQLPLYYGGRGRTRPEAGDWIGAEPDRASFLVRELTFYGGNRVQALDIMH